MILACLFLSAVETLTLPQLQQELDHLVQEPAFAGAKVGIYVHALQKDAVVYAKNPDTLLSPASNVKLITTAAALSTLKPDFRFRTEMLTDNAVGVDGVIKGNLYIRGHGDPSLVSERVWYMVNELWHMGVRRITGNVIGDDSYFDDDRAQAGWDEDTSDRAYQAMTSGLSLNFNTITLRLTPGPNRVGRVLFDPPSDFAKLDANVLTQGKRSRVSIDVSPLDGASRDQVKVTGNVAPTDGGRAYWRKVDFPTEFTTHVIAAFAKNAGITIDGTVKTGVTPKEAGPILSVDSSRLADIVGDLNKTSNNFVAEQLLKTMGAEQLGAPGTWDKGLSVVKQYLAGIGIKDVDYKLSNGSGLGDVNRLTAHQLAWVLRAAYRDPVIQPEYVASLGVAGSSGTLRNRMQSGPAAYRVRAKTGSLSNACSLSGYVSTLGGEVLAFSILVNGFKRMSAVHDLQDAIAEALVRLK